MIEEIISSGQGVGAWPREIIKLYKLNVAKRILQEGPFQLTLGLLFCLATLAIDALVAPSIMRESAMLRILAVAPFTLVGLIALSRRQTKTAAVCIGSSMIAFGAVIVYLTQFFPPEVASRYLLGVAVLPAFANIILPLSPNALIRFNGSYVVTAMLAISVCLPQGLMNQLDVIALMVVAMFATHQIALRQEELRQRNFLLDLLGRVTTAELSEANRKLQHLSERDPLTGLPNRRYFEQEFESRFAVVEEDNDTNIALMMIDLDHFKLFNDRHGHQSGDQCLRIVGVAIDGVLRDHETCFARYGGEEFILVMRETNPGDAERLAERVRAAVHALPGSVGNLPLITTSIGVAIAPAADGFTQDDLIEMADAALYSAKRAGRNRYEVVEAGREPEALSA